MLSFLLFQLAAFPHLAVAPLPSTPSSASSYQVQPTRTTLTVGKNRLDVLLATDPASREQGLMNKKSLGMNEGMLFVFPHSQRASFWMKDTPLPLSIAYLNSNGHILEIHDLEPFNERSVFSSSQVIVYALEVSRGWFGEHQVLSGDLVTGLPSPAIAH